MGETVMESLQHLMVSPLPKLASSCYRMGTTLVVINCFQGPDTMMHGSCPRNHQTCPAREDPALPIAYRTSQLFMISRTWFAPIIYPHGLSAFYISEREIAKFTKTFVDLGLKYMGICCGNTGN